MALKKAKVSSDSAAVVLVLFLASLLLAFTTNADAVDATTAPPETISPAQCKIVNPDPFVTLPPAPGNNILAALPYNDFGYETCVQQRCECADDELYTPGSGIYCSGSAFSTNGAITCNKMTECFKFFWECVTENLVSRYAKLGNGVDPSELAAVTAMQVDGQTPGQPFEDTVTYESCSYIQWQAADAREPCGLGTCIPNNTQCVQYLIPPPLPYNHQLCTQGCVAVLMLMALTIMVFFSAICCCVLCPAQVVVIEPLIQADALEDDRSRKTGSRKAGSRKTHQSNTSTERPRGGSEQQSYEPAQEDHDNDSLKAKNN